MGAGTKAQRVKAMSREPWAVSRSDPPRRVPQTTGRAVLLWLKAHGSRRKADGRRGDRYERMMRWLRWTER